MGFVCADRLPLGYGGIVVVPALDKRTLRIHSTVLRCREVTPGWYDGALYFNRPQIDLRIEPPAGT
jgi:hypothetical protein